MKGWKGVECGCGGRRGRLEKAREDRGGRDGERRIDGRGSVAWRAGGGVGVGRVVEEDQGVEVEEGDELKGVLRVATYSCA